MGAAVADRERTWRRLERRNRTVGRLRWALPALGVVVMLAIGVQVAIDAIRNQLGFANIRIDRDNLVVDTPELSATEPDGTVYSVKAREARTALAGSDRIDLVDMVVTVTRSTAQSYTASAVESTLQTGDQVVTVPGTMTIARSDGMTGTLEDVLADFPNRTMVAGGAVDISFPDGAHLSAESMYYDGTTSTWSFNTVTLRLNETPGATP